MTREKQNKFTFSKRERLYLRKDIDNLFQNNSSFIAYPLRVIYSEKVFENLEGTENKKNIMPQILISVPKRMLKKANKRNRIKRLIKEAYRLNKNKFDDEILIEKQLIIGFIYLKKELSSFDEIEMSIKKSIKIISNKIKERKAIHEKNYD